MKDRVLICNDDGIQMIHNAVPGHVEESCRDWVDFFLDECGVDVFAFCTARPDRTHHETKVAERDFSRLDVAPSQAQLHYKQALDELRDSGTDILHTVTDQVHNRGKRALASVRMSDVHHESDTYSFLTPKIIAEHPEWRILREDGSRDVAMDYSHQDLRNYRLAILAEIVDNYDVDGIELDFMRSCRYFAPHRAVDLCGVMSDFVASVRERMDRAASQRGTDRLTLGVRLPPSLDECRPLGLDPAAWVSSGWIDYVAPSDFMWLDYGTKVEEFAELCEGTDCGVYPCVNPFAAQWVDHRATNAYTPNPVNFNRRVFFTEQQFRGLLRNFDAWGADGTYTFNFCCETIDNPDYVRLAHRVVRKSSEQLRGGPATYTYLPIWRSERSPSGAPQAWRTLRFGRDSLGLRQVFQFRIADGRRSEPVEGRLRFRIYNLHDRDRLDLDLNGIPVSPKAIIQRRKTNIHLAADSRYPGMHIPPHIAYELDLARCPALSGDCELGLKLQHRVSDIASDCMLEAVEIDVGWSGTPQTIGYVIQEREDG